MENKFLLKDHLFPPAKIQRLSQEIGKVYAGFDEAGFCHSVLTAFPKLELKERIACIAKYLYDYLPKDYAQAVWILVKSLPPPNAPNLTDGDFGDFMYAAHSLYIATYGCKKDYLDLSYSALHALTQRFSAEDAIRYFINAFPEPTLSRLELWCHDPHYHVRRLCSEGTRPKLPWAQKIHIPLDAPIHLLDLLHADPTRYVTRSVANHLNDIGKLNPDLVLEVLKRWSLAGKQSSQEMEFMARHALRSLVKTGNPQALDWLGFKIGTPCQVDNLCVPKLIQMNRPFEFSFEVLCPNHLSVMIKTVAPPATPRLHCQITALCGTHQLIYI